MDISRSGFSFAMEGLDRQLLLEEAANRLDALRGTLGTNQKVAESPEGAFVRAFLQDNVHFASSPVFEQITDAHFLQQSMTAPIRFTQMQKHYNFYWFEPTIILFPRRNWKFHRLEVFVEFNPDTSSDTLRPTAYQILPDKKFQSLMKVGGSLNISLDENFEFQVQTGSTNAHVGPVEGKLNAGIGAKTEGHLGLIAGPFVYHLKHLQIDHNAVGAEKVLWRLNGSEFFQENTPRLVVIIQTPRKIKELKIAAEMQAYHKMSFPSSVQEALKELPVHFQNFFKGGTPIPAKTIWNVSSRL